MIGVLMTTFIGLGSIAMGLSYVWDYSRYSYVFSSQWANGRRFASIPIGVVILLFNIYAFIDVNSIPLWVNIVIFGGGSIIALGFNFFPPRFLYPEWYKWIQANHREIWPLLREEAAQDYDQWYKDTRTIEGLETWVEQVREKYNLR